MTVMLNIPFSLLTSCTDGLFHSVDVHLAHILTTMFEENCDLVEVIKVC